MAAALGGIMKDAAAPGTHSVVVYFTSLRVLYPQKFRTVGLGIEIDSHHLLTIVIVTCREQGIVRALRSSLPVHWDLNTLCRC